MTDLVKWNVIVSAVDKHDNPWLQIEQLQMEIERLKSAIDKQIETHNQSCVCPCCTASLAWTTEKDQKP